MNLYNILAGVAGGVMLLGLLAPYFGFGLAHHTYHVSLSFAVLMVVIALWCRHCCVSLCESAQPMNLVRRAAAAFLSARHCLA